MTPWDNPTVDALVWAGVILAVMAVLWGWARREARKHLDRVLTEPSPVPISEPIRHVRIDDNGRVHKVGVDFPPPSEMEDRLHLSIYDTYRGQLGHTPFCRSADGTELTCECDEVSA